MDSRFEGFGQMHNNEMNSSTQKCTGKLTKIILVKGVPYGTKQADLENEICKWGRIKRILPKPSTSHYYIEFEVSNFYIIERN